jgi:predicted GNAT family acetyltransferase
MDMTPPRNLILFGKPAKRNDIESMVDFFSEENIEVPGVIGNTELVGDFAEIWTERNKVSASVQMEQHIYRLDEVSPVRKCPGHLRLVTQEDLPLVYDWVHAFSVEAIEPMSKQEAQELVDKRTEQLYVWDDGAAVSMAAQARPTKNGAVVSLVYTPPELRKKGYATSCVAALSKRLLEEGFKFCSLYTDAANPSSNKIYETIGYKRVVDSIVYEFHRK